MTSLTLAIRRLRADCAPAIASGLLILLTATVFGAAPRLLDRLGNDALHGAVAGASAFARNISLSEVQGLPPDPADPLRAVEAEGDRIDGSIPAGVRDLIVTRHVVVDSVRYLAQGVKKDPTTIRFRIQPGAGERLRYVAGSAPSPVQRTMAVSREVAATLNAPGGSGIPDVVPLLETAIAADALHISGLAVGDTLFLATDLADPLAGGQRGFVAARISGAVEAIDPADPFWYDDLTLSHVTVRATGPESRTLDLAGYLPSEAYAALADAATRNLVPVRYTWRHDVDPSRLMANSLAATTQDLRRLETTFPQAQLRNAAAADPTLRSGLLPLLVAHAARWASASAILAVVAVGPAAVALVALVLIATLHARRRRPAIALVRGRGASLGQVVPTILLEGLLIAIPAFGVAVLVAGLLLPDGDPVATVAGAAVAAGAAVLLLVAVALPGTAAAARSAHEDDPSPRTAGIRRLVLDLLVTVGAAAGAFLLRERGLHATGATGTLVEADPLIVAVPALGGIAAGLMAARALAVPLRILGRVAARGRGLVLLLAVRRAIDGGMTTAVLVVLLAAASIGAFASAATVHLDRSRSAASWQEIGAPYRVTSPVGGVPTSIDAGRLPGVTGSATLAQSRAAVRGRNVPFEFAAIDLAEYARLLGGTPADLALPPEMLDPVPADGVVPILISDELAAHDGGPWLGQQLEILVNGFPFPVRPIVARASFPTLQTGTLFGVASRQQLLAIHPDARLTPTVLFLDGPAEPAGADAIRQAVAAVAPGATVASRAAFEDGLRSSPVGAALGLGITLASGLAALYAAIAVIVALSLAGAARETEVTQLRMIGMSRRDGAEIAILEHGPTVAFAIVAGIALGFGMFALIRPGLGLDTLVGSTVAVPLTPDLRQLLGIAGGVLGVAAVAIGLAAWMQWRGGLVGTARRGSAG